MQVSELIRRAADRNGFVRDRYEEDKIPTDSDNLAVFLFLGDFYSTAVLSSLLLNRYREESKGSKYFILASWPGMQNLFPYADEYWSFSDHAQLRRIYSETRCMENRSDINTIYLRNLNEFFHDVSDWRSLSHCYDNGLQQGFWDNYRHVKRFLPMVPSSAVLGKEFNSQLMGRGGYKVFLTPVRYGRVWRHGKVQHVDIPRNFWVELVKRLNQEGFTPVVWNHYLTYDISPEFTDACLFFSGWDSGHVMAAMRATGCVLDVFGGMTGIATLARTPVLSVIERSLHTNIRQWEFDDLVCPELPKQYIFSFATIITDGNPHMWNMDILNGIIKRLRMFLPELSRDSFPSTAESVSPVAYEAVRNKKNKKLGARLLKIIRD